MLEYLFKVILLKNCCNLHKVEVASNRCSIKFLYLTSDFIFDVKYLTSNFYIWRQIFIFDVKFLFYVKLCRCITFWPQMSKWLLMSHCFANSFEKVDVFGDYFFIANIKLLHLTSKFDTQNKKNWRHVKICQFWHHQTIRYNIM